MWDRILDEIVTTIGSSAIIILAAVFYVSLAWVLLAWLGIVPDPDPGPYIPDPGSDWS